MLTLAATLTLTLSTGGLLHGAMPAGVHLVEDLTLGQLPEVTPQSLQQQIGELEDSMPATGGPVAMIVTGGVAALGGVLVAYLGLLTAALGGGATVLIAGGIAVIVGIPLLVVGAILLGNAVRERRAVGREIQQLKRQLRLLEQGVPPQPGPQTPLPPPPPPPQVEGPRPSLVLAVF